MILKNNMFLIRASLLLVVASMSWSEGAGEDRIGTILSMMADMRTHVNSLTESVKKIEQNEGDVAKKVGKIDTQMAQMKTEMKTEMIQMKTQIEQVKTQITQLETKVDNVDPWLPWKFIGHGLRSSRRDVVLKYGTTLQECVAFCTKKRQDSGATWNGLYWRVPDGVCTCNENENGHTENSNCLHFKI